MISQAVLSVLVILIPSGIICAGLPSSSGISSTSTSGGVNGGTHTQFAQAQNTVPATGFGYNYGNFYYPSYPVYPTYNAYGSINPGNQVQTSATLNSRFGNDVPVQTSAQNAYNPQPYGTNSVVAPLDYGQYLNNLQQQQNAFFLQQQQQQQQQLQQQLQQQQASINFPNPSLGVPNQVTPSLDSRFSDDSAPSGVSGISTASFSSSSDVNGKTAHHGGTRTVINKDGKIYVL